jgi:hypothetical protein
LLLHSNSFFGLFSLFDNQKKAARAKNQKTKEKNFVVDSRYRTLFEFTLLAFVLFILSPSRFFLLSSLFKPKEEKTS